MASSSSLALSRSSSTTSHTAHLHRHAHGPLRSPSPSSWPPFSPSHPPHSPLLHRHRQYPRPSPALSTTFEELNQGIAHFYDSSSSLWEDIWGEHMHHGFYDPDLPFWEALSSDHTAAQIRMIEQTLAWAAVADGGPAKPQNIVDVGCGIGGSSRYLARKYGASVVGITLSPKQAKRATELTESAGLGSKVSFEVADALNQPFPEEQFDLVWSMESGEHMPDKKKFLSELVRVTKPGGRIIVVTWCHRELMPEEKSLKPSEQELLDKICDAYYLPAWCAPSKYLDLAEELQLQDIKSDDWSRHITPFWPAVIVSALSWKGMLGLATSGWTTAQGAIAMAYMVQGYRSGLIKFAAITARKGS